MSNFLLDTINVICASVVVALSFVDNVSKKSVADKHKTWKILLENLKKARTKAFIIFIVTIIGIGVNYKKAQNVEADKSQSDITFRRELHHADSINQIKLKQRDSLNGGLLKQRDSINQIKLNQRDSIDQANYNNSLAKATGSMSAASANVMAKYYLKYDSTQQKIEKLVRDSASNNYIKPEVGICSINVHQKKDTSFIEATVCSKRSVAKKLEINYCVVVRPSDDRLEFFDGDKVNITKLVSPEGEETHFNYSNKFKSCKRIYFYTYGNFLDERNNHFKFSEIRFYDFNAKREGFLTDKESAWIMDFIRKHGINPH